MPCSLRRSSVCMLLLCLGGLGTAADAAGPTSPAAPRASSNFSREQAQDVCTTEDRSQWLPEAEMRLLAQHRGYRIKTFKVANNSCYEVYGFDQAGRIVEAYFNPVNAKLVRQNIAQ